MAFNLSTGLQKALLGENQGTTKYLAASTISMGDGDGSVISGADTINDSGSGFTFAKHDWVLIISGDANNNKLVKVLSATTAKLEVEAGSFTAVSAGSTIILAKMKTIGCVKDCLANGIMVGYTGTRPADGDQTETGTKLIEITKDGGSFSAGVSLNGLNLTLNGTDAERAVDPETGSKEVWEGTASSTNTVGYMRWYANEYVTGASITALRMDGAVATSGSDVNMANGTQVTNGSVSNVTSVSLDMSGV